MGEGSTTTSWTVDKRWSDKFLDEIKSILGRYLIGEAPIEEDQERNTDLVVLRLEAVRVACRMRKHQYLQRYPDEFTIREGRPSGVKTELSKVLEGWAQYLFYAFADEAEDTLAAWMLGDLNVFRLWFQRYLAEHKGLLPGSQQQNRDESSWFRAFSLRSLPPKFVVARYTGGF